MPEYTSGKRDVVLKALPSLGLHSREKNEAFPWWVTGIVLLGALGMATGGLIALLKPSLLVSPHDEINGAVHIIYAGYFASRALVLAAMLLAALLMRARGLLNSLMLLAAFIQLMDFGVDCLEGRLMVIPGVVVLDVLFFVGAARLSGYPFWRARAWS
jgi:predicted lysophospholipase L1 biosynthesis ABC-type transport system permease subunit